MRKGKSYVAYQKFSLRKRAKNLVGALVTAPNADVSAIYVAKYNRFVDTILGRINKILKDKYDPVTVKLVNPSASSKNKKSKSSSKNKSKKSKRRKSNKSRARTSRDLVVSAEPADNVTGTAAEIIQQLTEEPKVTATTLNPVQNSSGTSTTTATNLATRLTSNEVSATSSTRGTDNTSSKRKKNKTRTTTKSGSKTRKPSGSSNKVKQQSKPSKKPRSKAKATLYGLSSLKRAGDVSVNMMSDHTTIRTRFNLGPLVLKVEKEFARSTRKEVRSATATTAEMSGRLSLRVYHGGAATLHSIRVLQPKQMRIESADDHDRTREFVWKRSSHIAHLVSQKLSSATRSMLRPSPSAAAAA